MATPKRIQKHLIDRNDTMYYENEAGRHYASAHNGLDAVNFSMSIWDNSNDSVTFYYESSLGIEMAMRMIMPDLRKWRVLKNGQ